MSEPRPPGETRPSLSRSSSSWSSSSVSFRSGGGYEADDKDNWAGALTLLDVFETFFDSRLDLLERRLKAQSHRLKQAAAELIPRGLRTPRGTPLDPDDDSQLRGGDEQRRNKYKIDPEREVERLRIKLATKVNDLSKQWQSAQIVRTRDKISFLFGVMTLTFTCLVCGYAPEWIPTAYTVQSTFYLTTRFWSYKRKAYHYFLFDLCYFVNIMDLFYIWFFRDNVYYFIMCWCLTLGPIASAIITWRNSLVFHSLDKVTSLFIHMYPPLTFIVIQHFAKDRELNYPAIVKVKEFSWWQMILWSALPYVLWQGMYWKLVLVDRREKIESGQRQTSFRYMLNDKHGPIGKALQGIQPKYRETSFMAGQLVYSLVFMLPAATFLIKSPNSCIVFLIFVFGVSAWNGASYYVEVFGRKFEKELEKLRREMESSPHSSASMPGSTTNSPPRSPRTLANTVVNSQSSTNIAGQSQAGENGLKPARGLNDSPLALGPTLGSVSSADMDDLSLDEGKKER